MADVTRTVHGYPPGSDELPSTNLETGVFDVGTETLPIEANLPYLVLYNSDSVGHVLTAKPRSGPGVGKTSPPITVAPLSPYTLPTAIFGNVTDGAANGKVSYYYSDVPGPSRGSGGPFNYTNERAVSTTQALKGSDELVLASTPSADITLTLPAANASTPYARKLIIIKTDAAVHNVSVSKAGADTIEGAATKTIAAQYGKLGLISDGVSVWYDLGTGGV